MIWLERLWSESVYWTSRFFATLVFGVLFPLRVSGHTKIPARGAVLILANHQSYLDPILVGLPAGRKLRYLARKSLFRFVPFRWLILGLGAISVDRDGVAKEGLKASLRALSEGAALAIWPEGTRTANGELQPLETGVLLLLRRSRAPVIVAGIAGSFECWPRGRPVPWPGPIWVHFEQWHPPETRDNEQCLASLQAALAEVARIAEQRREKLMASRRRAIPETRFRMEKSGVAD